MKKLSMVLAIPIVFTSTDSTAKEALDPALILQLKTSHLSTCTPTISQQLKSVGLNSASKLSKNYCECLGTLYFNEFTKKDYAEIQKEPHKLPHRMNKNRLLYQEYCAEIHLTEINQ